MSRTNKGIPVRFFDDDKYMIKIDVSNLPDEKYKAILALFRAIEVDWWEGYVHTAGGKKSE